MHEKIPETIGPMFPEKPERKKAIEDFDTLMKRLYKWSRDDPDERSASVLMHQYIVKVVDDGSLNRLTDALHHWLD